MVSTRTAVARSAWLANHAPLLAMLDPPSCGSTKSESTWLCFGAGRGHLQVGGNRALLLVEEAHESGALDAGELREAPGPAERELKEAA